MTWCIKIGLLQQIVEMNKNVFIVSDTPLTLDEVFARIVAQGGTEVNDER